MQTFFIDEKVNYYTKYRPPFPSKFIDSLAPRLKLSKHQKSGRLLDLGCGTGRLTLPFSIYFQETIGTDPSQDMLEAAQRAMLANPMPENICWLNGYAEMLPESLGHFNVITAANAFHWMDHTKVTPWVINHLAEQGYFVLIGSDGKLFSADVAWQQALSQLLDRWFGKAKEKVMASHRSDWASILENYSFNMVETHIFTGQRTWTTETLLGLLYSLSYCSPQQLGDRQMQFEQEIKTTLLALNQNNQFIENYKISTIVAKK